MKTSKFISLLKEQNGKSLLMEYSPGKTILPGYHITEIKNVSIESVDCGGIRHSKKQTVVQYIDGSENNGSEYMITDKAASIFELVDGVRKINEDAEIFIEFGNHEFPTSNYTISDIEISDRNLKFHLEVPPTVCKPSLVANENCCESSCC